MLDDDERAVPKEKGNQFSAAKMENFERFFSDLQKCVKFLGFGRAVIGKLLRQEDRFSGRWQCIAVARTSGLDSQQAVFSAGLHNTTGQSHGPEKLLKGQIGHLRSQHYGVGKEILST